MAGISRMVNRLLAVRRPRGRGMGSTGTVPPTTGAGLGGRAGGGVSGRGLRSLLRRLR